MIATPIWSSAAPAQEWEQRLNGVSYQTISANGGGINSTVRATRESSEARLLLAQQRLDRLLREGVTTLEIKSGYGLDLENERKMLRVARQLAQNNAVELSPTLLSAHATPPEYKDRPDAYITLVCETLLPTLWEEGCLKASMFSAKTSASVHSRLSAYSGPRRPAVFRSEDTLNSSLRWEARSW